MSPVVTTILGSIGAVAPILTRETIAWGAGLAVSLATFVLIVHQIINSRLKKKLLQKQLRGELPLEK